MTTECTLPPENPLEIPLPEELPAVQLPLQPSPDMVPALVAQVFEEAPLTVRGRLLEQLLSPLSLLSLAAVANGIFARITLERGWFPLQVSPEDANQVDAADVVALVLHVQEVSVQALDGLAAIIQASPVLTGSATAAMLLAILRKQAKARRPVLTNDFDPLG